MTEAMVRTVELKRNSKYCKMKFRLNSKPSFLKAKIKEKITSKQFVQLLLI